MTQPTIDWTAQQEASRQRQIAGGGKPGLARMGQLAGKERARNPRSHAVRRVAVPTHERDHEHDVAGGGQWPRGVPRHPAGAALQPAGDSTRRLVRHAAGLGLGLCRADHAAGRAFLRNGRTWLEVRATGLTQDRPVARGRPRSFTSGDRWPRPKPESKTKAASSTRMRPQRALSSTFRRQVEASRGGSPAGRRPAGASVGEGDIFGQAGTLANVQ